MEFDFPAGVNAIGGIIVCTAIGWFILGSSVLVRSYH
jgi:hypothetical protein